MAESDELAVDASVAPRWGSLGPSAAPGHGWVAAWAAGLVVSDRAGSASQLSQLLTSTFAADRIGGTRDPCQDDHSLWLFDSRTSRSFASLAGATRPIRHN